MIRLYNIKNKRKVLICTVESCGCVARSAGGLCNKHSGKKAGHLCRKENCGNKRTSNSFCLVHGGKFTICSVEGCSTKAVRQGVCSKHGGRQVTQRKRICTYEGCTNQVVKNKLCGRHLPINAKRICTEDGCKNKVQSKGLCRMHGAPVKICSVRGCSQIVVVRGVCMKHAPDSYREQKRYYTNTYLEDVSHKLASRLRSRIRNAVINGKGIKSASTLELLGCSINEVRVHIESLWTDGMSWENYGTHGWHIDHIKPCAKFNLEDPEEQKKCFHYTNLQPLWAIDNYRKHDSYEDPRR